MNREKQLAAGPLANLEDHRGVLIRGYIRSYGVMSVIQGLHWESVTGASAKTGGGVVMSGFLWEYMGSMGYISQKLYVAPKP